MEFDVWMLLAGIGIFLFGIYLMEESLKLISGNAFKKFIRKHTSTTFRALLTGTFSTAILQSSSAVILMVLAFVGAGIMQLRHAFGVILGSNLGTTFTSWIVATLGFKVDIQAFAMPFIGLGGLGLIFLGRETKASNYSKLLVGFGFLFLGLEYMKSSVEALTQILDLSSLSNYPIILFALIGFVITAIMQSSSATMAIILTALYGDVIDFYAASSMVIGANLGTTMTAVIGTIGGSIAKKQVAAVHVVFNLVTAIVAFVLIIPLNYLVLDFFKLKDDPLIALALFHTLFKVLGILIFFPFSNWFSSLIEKYIPERHTTTTLYLHKTTPEVVEAGISSLENELKSLLELVIFFEMKVLQIKSNEVFSADKRMYFKKRKLSNDVKIYALIRRLQSEIFVYAAKLQSREMSLNESSRLNSLLNATRFLVASAKTLKDVNHEIDVLFSSEDPSVKKIIHRLKKQAKKLFKSYDGLVMDNKTDLALLVKSAYKIIEKDTKSVHYLTQLLMQASYDEATISAILQTNRSFSLSMRQLNLGVKELLSTEEEIKLYQDFVLEN